MGNLGIVRWIASKARRQNAKSASGDSDEYCTAYGLHEHHLKRFNKISD